MEITRDMYQEIFLWVQVDIVLGTVESLQHYSKWQNFGDKLLLFLICHRTQFCLASAGITNFTHQTFVQLSHLRV